HLDNEVAKRAGLPGIVVHGLCTMAMTSEGIIKSYLDNNSNDLVSLGVRFSAPVFPGDELEIEVSKTSQEGKLAFHVIRKSDGIKVIRDGTLEVKI
ncbi:MAG: MaoC/PaaZ C-terminal domain-containing protein, partial [Candidatus Dadabacteria bacterium]